MAPDDAKGNAVARYGHKKSSSTHLYLILQPEKFGLGVGGTLRIGGRNGENLVGEAFQYKAVEGRLVVRRKVLG